MPALPEPGVPLDFAHDTQHRLDIFTVDYTSEELDQVAQAIEWVTEGRWYEWPAWEDLSADGVLHMLLGADLMFSWRLYPGTEDVAQLIYVGHPGLFG